MRRGGRRQIIRTALRTTSHVTRRARRETIKRANWPAGKMTDVIKGGGATDES